MTNRGRRDGGRQPGGPDQPASTRATPHNIEAEESLLGAALLSAAALEITATKIRPDDFYRPNHRHIAAALTDAYEAGESADPVTIGDRLQRQGLLDTVGGLVALLSLQANTPATSNAGRYAQIIHDYATLRRLIGSAGEIAELGYEVPDDVHQAVERAQAMLADVAANNGNRSYSTLNFADVAALIQAGIPTVEAEFLTRSDGRRLFYAGKIHFLQAEPSAGKTFIALFAVLEVINMGATVLYLDYEDTAATIIGRLIALGADAAVIADRFRHVSPEGPFGVSERIELERRIADLAPELIVIDGVAEALVREGASEDRNSEVIAWIEKVPRWLARTGAAVVMLDHLKKPQAGDPSGGRYARGAGAKLGAVDGAAYEVKIQRSFSRHRSGLLRLVIAKDRPGGVGAIGETAAMVHVEPHGDGDTVIIRLDPPSDDNNRPTRTMEAVSRLLEEAAAPMAPAQIKAVVNAKPRVIEASIGQLTRDGHIKAAPGRALQYESVTPYRAPDEDHTEPPDDQPEQREFTDAELFADIPDPTVDELAERRRRKEPGADPPDR